MKNKLQHLYKINPPATTAPRWCCQKNSFLQRSGPNELWIQKIFFLTLPFSINFLLLTVTYQPYWIFKTLFNQNYHIAKAPSIPKHMFKVWKPNRKLILYYGKVKETTFTSVKKTTILSFLGTRICLKEKLRLQLFFFYRFFKLYVSALIGYLS